ncbi:DUF1501 domain-containing protein [Fimbriiglobus ruber]|uniref:DUF1501 domain-containing protein n=1 Tax=Fimbriiglobus ruber TaxID=1908690 RepID=A0A225DKY7_9BACT|nr:DUF1501 domain-containing protein [Fimbriiglobus ruber]OWK40324.1 hypothetical protein FRUB_05243 [Fimbriiglobus ruber]
MNTSFDAAHRPTSDRLSRRRLLQFGSLGALSLSTPGILAASVGSSGTEKTTEKSCIFILLCGGPSHIDTWDLKPDAPAEIRGPYRPAATTVPGMRISELHPRLATMAKEFCLIRSMTHPGNISNHFDAMHNALSGQSDAPADSPYIGSVLAKVRPSQRSVASYVWLIKCVGDPVFCAPNIGTGGSLGGAYAPLFVGSAENNPARPGFKAPDALTSTEPAERMLGRRQMLDDLDQRRGADRHDWRAVHRRGFELATAAGPRRAFEMDLEDPRLRDRYGRNPLGQNLLLARRLVESGVGFVTVNGWTGPAPGQAGGGPPSSSWDMHGGEMGMGNAFGTGSYGMGWCLPVLDAALSALLTDLRERGLLDSTLVVVAGEFGRTPRINQNQGASPGRQHWPACYSAILAGGGIRGGMVYGESDKIGAYVKDKPVRPQDLSATIYHALGVPFESRVTRDGLSKPLSTGQPILDLFE